MPVPILMTKYLLRDCAFEDVHISALYKITRLLQITLAYTQEYLPEFVTCEELMFIVVEFIHAGEYCNPFFIFFISLTH